MTTLDSILVLGFVIHPTAKPEPKHKTTGVQNASVSSSGSGCSAKFTSHRCLRIEGYQLRWESNHSSSSRRRTRPKCDCECPITHSSNFIKPLSLLKINPTERISWSSGNRLYVSFQCCDLTMARGRMLYLLFSSCSLRFLCLPICVLFNVGYGLFVGNRWESISFPRGLGERFGEKINKRSSRAFPGVTYLSCTDSCVFCALPFCFSKLDIVFQMVLAFKYGLLHFYLSLKLTSWPRFHTGLADCRPGISASPQGARRRLSFGATTHSLLDNLWKYVKL